METPATMVILEDEVWEVGIGGRPFRFVEFSSSELGAYIRRFNDLTGAVVLRMRQDSLADAAAAFQVVESEAHEFFVWLLNQATDKPVDLDWVRQNVKDSQRRAIFLNLDKLNNLDARLSNVMTLLNSMGRLQSTLSAGPGLNAFAGRPASESASAHAESGDRPTT